MADSKEEEEEVFMENPVELNGVPDLSMLIYLHMKNVLHNLHWRFSKMPVKHCYTSISTILVAVNPYEWLPITGPDVIEEFHSAAKRGVLPQNRPHPFGVSARSYMRMVQRKCNQSAIVCGESGAGKTETTKLLMRYLAMTAPSSSMDSSMVEKQIIAASPILEAYGNAKTVMNNNSSRFGKFTKLLYDVPAKAREGSILGSYLETYLLEKSRVVFQASNERNYHIFYFLHAGLAGTPFFDELKLSHCDNFWYTKQGKSCDVAGFSDLGRYEELRESLGLMRIDAEMDDLWRISAGLLHLGNVDFKKEGDGFATIKNLPQVKVVADLWAISDEALATRLTTMTLKIGKKNITKKVTFDDSRTNRDSITKGFYEQVFLFLCDRINAELYNEDLVPGADDDDSSSLSMLFIGILDVFGFENFYINSLEQFCINFTNEKLQQYFNMHIIRSEQEEYIKEGVFWTPLEIPDNEDYMSMVEQSKKGFFILLDSACRAPKPTAEAWLNELFKNWGANPCMARAKAPGAGNARGRPSKKEIRRQLAKKAFTGFTVLHFADTVCYDSTSFLVKNMEAVHPDTAKMLAKSSKPLVAQIGTRGTGGKRRKKASVTGVFAKGIRMLMKNLKQTEPFFVRCVNPNGVKSKTVWDEVVMEGQLRCGGLVEALKVLKLGYPTRVPYVTLYDKYHGTVTNPLIKNMGAEAFSTALLIGFDVNEDDYELGLTKIFFKPAKAAVLDTIMSMAGKPLSAAQNEKITKWVVQKRLKQMIGTAKAFVSLRNSVRLVRAAKKWEEVGRTASVLSHTLVRHLDIARANILERKRNEAAVFMQTLFRSCYERERFNSRLPKFKKSTKMLWISFKRWQERQELKKFLDEKVAATRKRKAEEERKRREEEARRKAEELRRHAEEAKQKKEMDRLAEEERLRAEAEATRERARAEARRKAEEAERLRLEEERKRKEEEERIRLEKERLAAEEAKRVEEARVAEEKRKEEEEKKRLELEAQKQLAREKQETASTNVESARIDRERKRRDKRRLDRHDSVKRSRKARKKAARKRKEDREERHMRENFPEQFDSDEEDYYSGEESEESESEEESDPRATVSSQLKRFDKIASTGQLFLKYTGKRRRKPQDRIVKVTFDGDGTATKISWGSGSRHINFDEVMYIAHGHWTPVFQARKDSLDAKVCFSVVGKSQILDIQAPSKTMALVWVKGLRRLIGQTDEQATKLSKENLEKLLDDGERKKKKGDAKKDHQRRAKSLMLLQQDLFVMTTTTVFRNLEEERIWDIDQSVRDRFNAKLLYEEALRQDVPWRQWTQWIRDQITAFLRESGRVLVPSGGMAAMGGGGMGMMGGMGAMGGMSAMGGGMPMAAGMSAMGGGMTAMGGYGAASGGGFGMAAAGGFGAPMAAAPSYGAPVAARAPPTAAPTYPMAMSGGMPPAAMPATGGGAPPATGGAPGADGECSLM